MTRGLQRPGLVAIPMDITYSAGQDIMSDKGFSLVLQLALRLRWGSVCWLAPPCSSWVWLSRLQHTTPNMSEANHGLLVFGHALFVRTASL